MKMNVTQPKPVASVVPQNAQSLDVSGPLDAFLARHGRRRWAILLRRGAMMPEPTIRSTPKASDRLRFYATRSGWLRCRGRPVTLRQPACGSLIGRRNVRYWE